MEPVSTTLALLVIVGIGKMVVPEYTPNSCSRCGHDNEKGVDFCEKCGVGMRPYNNSAVAEQRAQAHAKRVAEARQAQKHIERQRKNDQENLDKRIAKNVRRRRKALEQIPWCGKCEKEFRQGIGFCNKCGSQLARLPDQEIDKRLSDYKNSFWSKL